MFATRTTLTCYHRKSNNNNHGLLRCLAKYPHQKFVLRNKWKQRKEVANSINSTGRPRGKKKSNKSVQFKIHTTRTCMSFCGQHESTQCHSEPVSLMNHCQHSSPTYQRVKLPKYHSDQILFLFHYCYYYNGFSRSVFFFILFVFRVAFASTLFLLSLANMQLAASNYFTEKVMQNAHTNKNPTEPKNEEGKREKKRALTWDSMGDARILFHLFHFCLVHCFAVEWKKNLQNVVRHSTLRPGFTFSCSFFFYFILFKVQNLF